MCLIALGIGQHAKYPLILAANRDEFHARPTKEAHWWPDKPDILGGRDLQAGGTWLGLHRSGRFATVTNFRDVQPSEAGLRSRGHLVTGFLESHLDPVAYLDTIDESRYAGFNLIVGAKNTIAYLSNREQGTRRLDMGVYGLSNALLDGPWHKVERSKKALAGLLADGKTDETQLMRLMNDRCRAPVTEVETGRLDFGTAHAVTAPFIVLPEYGTRSTTVILADRDGNWRFTERRLDPAGRRTGESTFTVGR